MASLLEILTERPGSRPLVYSGEKWFETSELVGLALDFRRRNPSAEVSNIVFRATNPFEALVGCLALDGYAQNILVSSDKSNVVAESLFKDRISGCLFLNIDSSENTESSLDFSGPSRCQTVWTIPTSGTTGTPKLVQHTLESLTRSVKRDSTRGADLVWGQLYEISRFAGLQVLFQALLGGSSLALFGELADPSGLGKTFKAAGVNALSATPTMWRRLLMAGAIDALDLSIITLGGEATDDFLLNELAAKFPAAKISHIYASTEAGVGFSVTDRKAGFPARYLDEELANGVRLRVDTDGRLFLRRPQDLTSYLGEGLASGEDGWIDSGDLVERAGDRYLFIGRANGAINVGGMKVQPSQIEQVILSHPSVAMVVVSARKNPFMGNLVQATVVPRANTDTSVLKVALTTLCREKLDAYMVPAVWRFVDELPITSAGKIGRS
jgi:acyl-coenzyme A synthetase/AMP-(fatty) acid ligase